MRNLLVAMIAAVAMVSVATFAAEAQMSRGATFIKAAAEKSAAEKPKVENAACRGRGAHCPPGYVWNGHRCVPC
jgi:hypothetical protein